MSTTSPYSVIRVTPTLETSEYAVGDVLFASQEIPNAVYGKGGCSKLIGFGMIDYSDQLINDFNIRFTSKQANMGTTNAGVTISDADFKTAEFLGHIVVDTSNWDIDNVNNKSILVGEQGTSQVPELYLQAASDSTSVYFTCENLGSAITYAADSLEFWFMLKRY